MVFCSSRKSPRHEKNPKYAWAAIKILKKGLTSHHVHPTIMHMKLMLGVLAFTNEENASISGPHLDKVYNAKIPVDWDYVRQMIKKRKIWSLNDPILWWDFEQAIANLTYDEAVGLNKVSPNAIKALADDNITHLVNFCNSFFADEKDYKELHESQVRPIPGKTPPTTEFHLFGMLYADNGVLSYITRRYLETGAKLVHKQFE